MNASAAISALVVGATVAQLLIPGQNLYHKGWYSAAIAALVIVLLFRLRADRRPGFVAIVFGVAILGIAGIACGLLAPDTQTVVGAPGSTVKVDALARTIDFPPMQNEPSQRLLPVGGAFLLRPVPRTVVEVQAFDAAGRHLTVTQPSGSSFLSPVLLMQARQTIAGMNLPYDSFAVPAAHRLVRAVLFTAQEAAQMRGARGNPGAAVLFDVEDESGRSVARGLALARSNETISVAGLALRPNVTTYNATDVVAIPNIFAVMLGLIAISSGAILNATAKTPSRS